MTSIIRKATNCVISVPPAYFVFSILLIVLWVSKPHMLNINIMGIFIRQVVPLGIVVLGQMMVMRVRSIDLSAGGVILLVNYYISSNIFGDISPNLHILIAISTGMAVGLFNGVMVGIRRSSSVIVTLAVSIILIGIVQYLASGKPPGDVPEVFNNVYNTKFLSIPSPVLFWIALTAVMAVFLSKFVFGRYVSAVGENPIAAHFAGVPVAKTVVISHTIAGFMAAVAALVQTASLSVGSVRIGLDLPILAVAATILGGVIFGRGEGGVWGPFFGVLCFAFLFVVMTTFGIQEPGKLISQGVIILLAAIFYGLREGS
ncbi:MAG: ABC transporter permease [Granulosicoccus sp.]